MSEDPRIYPIAMETIPFGAKVHLKGLRAWLATPALPATHLADKPSYSLEGDTAWYAGNVMRVWKETI